MLTTAAWADDVMYVIATELGGNITITQKNEDGGSSNLSVKKVKLTFYYGERPTSYAEGSEVWSQRTESFGGSCIFDVPTAVPTSNDYHYPAWYVNSSKNAAKRHEAVTQISFDASFAAARPKSTAYWFYNMKNLTSNIIDFTNLNTSSTKSMNHMFYGCQSIKNLDLSGWNVANVTDMGYMFSGCQRIKNLDLSGWNVSKVTNMSYMFSGCQSIQNLDLSGWNVSKVTNMSYMFSGCSNLNKIKLIGWKVTSLQNTSRMFADCEKLTYIYCDGDWDTSKLTKSLSMFNNCTSLPGYKSTYVNKRKAKPQPDGYFTSTGLTLNVSDGYYEIADEQDLIDFSNYVSASVENTCAGLTFKMTADLDFTDKPDSCHDNNGIGSGNFRPVGIRAGAENTAFKGHFDGNGHSITGLRFDYGNDRSQVGLFTSIAGGVVEGVTLVNPTFRAVVVGGIANYISDATVRNCAIVGGSITGSDGIGGIVGHVVFGTISGCAVIGTTISNGSYAGVFVGQNLVHDNYNSCTISNCNYYNPTVANMCSGVTYTDGGGNQQVYQVTLGEGITAASPAFAYDNKAYYAENATVTLGTNRTGYLASGYQSNDVTISNGSFKMPKKDVTVNGIWTPDPDFSANGDDTEYTINNATGWDKFCDLLASNEKGIFTGKTVKLDDDISVSSMAGSNDKPFTGTFDGDGKTLTVDYNATENYTAPFRYVEDGAVIKNLHVDGTITTDYKYATGLVGSQLGEVNISNCRSSVTIQSSKKGEGTHAGLVAAKANSDKANLTIDGCVFDGKIISTGTDATTDCGGFVGYKGNNGSLTITNSLYAPQTDAKAVSTGATFARNWSGAPTNSYYTQALGTAQGNFAHAVDAAPANLGEAVTDESITVLTAYENGILFDKKYYVAPQAVTLADNAANDLSGINGYLADVTLDGRTLYKDGDWNTLCLPFDVTIEGSVLDGADVRELADANLTGEVLTLNFTKEGAVSTIEAGKPYIIKWEKGENLVSPVFKGVTVSSKTDNFESTDHNVYFKGTYAPLAWTEETPSILFLGAGNKLHWPLAGARLNAFRAYFELNGEAKAREFVVNFDGETTGISNTDRTDYTDKADAWYTVNGVKLDKEPTKPGLYIYKGKKVKH